MKIFKDLMESARLHRMMLASLKNPNDPNIQQALKTARERQKRRDAEILAKAKKKPKFFERVRKQSSVDPFRLWGQDRADVKIIGQIKRKGAVRGRGLNPFDAGHRSESKAMPLIFDVLRKAINKKDET